MSFEVSFSGPVFDGAAQRLIGEMVEKIRETVATDAYDRWKGNMDEHFRVNHGVYTGFAQKVQEGSDVVVNDGWSQTNDLPYGLWLEGIGSRNAPVTVFEGYHSLRDAYEVTEQQVLELADPVVADYVDRINHA